MKTINIELDVHQALRMKAATTGRTLAEEVDAAMRKYLKLPKLSKLPKLPAK